MTDKEQDQHLRTIAQGAGLRLVKSLRRKPGGDYGRYGLKTAEGQPCFGVEESGLTATAEDIEQYLRNRARKLWNQSVSATKPLPATRSRKTSQMSSAASPEPERTTRGIRAAPTESPPVSGKPRQRKGSTKQLPRPELRVREAEEKDLPGIMALVRQLGIDTPDQHIRSLLLAAIRQQEAPLVAELEGIVGCIAFHPVPVLLRGSIVGRITALVVEERHRRVGIGTSLLREAEARLSKRGCSTFELVTEIDYDTPSEFLRTRDYRKRAYRFEKTSPS